MERLTSPWKDKRVLVTGVTGFIGKALAQRLVIEGAEVTGLIANINRNMDTDFLERINVVLGDVTDFDVVCETVSTYEIDVVFHLAANAIVRIAARDPRTTYSTNVMGTVNVLEACRQVGRCESIVVASSDKAYGNHAELPYTEAHALQPENTYDTSKACADMIARTYAHNYGMPIIVTRCSNVYGPGDKNMSRIIPNSIRLVLEGKPPMLYSDVEQMEREFIYIDDVVEAYLFLARYQLHWKGQALNIGGTGAVKIGDMAKMICEVMGKPELRPTIVQRDPVFKEIQKQYIDATKLKMYGWKPNVDLREGLRRSAEWYGRLMMWGKE